MGFTSGDVTAASSVGTEESDLEAAVSRQPISVAIEADQPVFQHYTGGVLSDTACGQRRERSVFVVWYGVDDGQKNRKIEKCRQGTMSVAGCFIVGRVPGGCTAEVVSYSGTVNNVDHLLWFFAMYLGGCCLTV